MKRFVLKADRFEHKAGTVVYEWRGHDYGLARDYSYITKQPHVSVTKNADLSHPFFTVPESDLEEIVGAVL